MSVILSISGKKPHISDGVFLAPTAAITGDVTLGKDVSAFYGVSVRGDSAAISVADRSNLQDNVVLHADEGFPCTIGVDVSVGHSAVVHGARVEDGCLIGMSATVMNGAVVGRESLVAAGALITQGMTIPPRSLVAGSPGKVRRQLTEDEVKGLRENAATYIRLKDAHIAAGASDGSA